MKWFEGGISEAVTTSKKKGAIFVVYIEGKEESSHKLTDVIEKSEVAEQLGSEQFVAIKIDGDSVLFTQFSQIYKQASVPSLFFIGKNGLPIEIITQNLDAPQLMAKINAILDKNVSQTQAASTSAPESQTPVTCENNTVKPKPPITSEQPVASSIPAEVTTEEKLERAKQLIEAQQRAKQKDEEEKERLREIDRRKEGQNALQFKQWQQDQEMKQLKEERERIRKEEQDARQRILAQIAQDKADRAARFSRSPVGALTAAQQTLTHQQNSHTQKSTSSNSKTARLQFRLPDGSTRTSDFDSSDLLQVVREYIRSNLNLPFRNFALSTTFPRREFSADDNQRTLLDLELCPNAVILILPLNQGVVAASNLNGFGAFFWSVVAPILGMLNYIKNWLFGSGGGGGVTTGTVEGRSSDGEPSGEGDSANLPERKRASPTSSTFPTGGTGPKRRIPESTVVRRQGNVHRLSDKTDSDEENNTWNGNSTQQM